MKELLEKLSPEDFVSVLPSSSRTQVTSMLRTGMDPMHIASQLAAEPGEGLATKGGERWPHDLLLRVKSEVRLFLCTEDPRYQSLRDGLKREGVTSARAFVFLISSAVAIHAGIAAALCVPLVALILAAASKVSLEAWCAIEAPNDPASERAETQVNPPGNT